MRIWNSKTCLKLPLLKRSKMGFQDQLLLDAGRKYCRMLQAEHSAILLSCIELPHCFKTFVLSFFEWPLKTGFTVFIGDLFFPNSPSLNQIGVPPLHYNASGQGC